MGQLAGNQKFPLQINNERRSTPKTPFDVVLKRGAKQFLRKRTRAEYARSSLHAAPSEVSGKSSLMIKTLPAKRHLISAFNTDFR